MDRKGIIGIIIAVLVLVYWQFENAKTQKLLADQRAVQAEAAAKAAAEAAPAPGPVAPAAPGAPVAPGVAPAPGAPAVAAVPTVPEELKTFDTPSLEYSFTNLGAGMQRVRLKNHKAEHGANVLINQFGSLPIGALSEGAAGQAMLPFQAVEGGAGEVVFESTDARGLRVRKKFILPQTTDLRGEYLATLEVTFINPAAQPLPVGAYYVYTGSAAPIHKIDQVQYTGFAWMPGSKFTFKGASSFLKGGFMGMGKEDAPIFAEPHEHTRWAGVTNQYFSSIVTPLETEGNGVWARRFAVDQALLGTGGEPGAATPAAGVAASGGAQPAHAEAVDGALAMPGFTLAADETKTQKFEIYTGPRQYERLKSLGHSEEEMMEFGIFKIVSKILLNSMNWLHSKLGSYAVAIIVLTIIIRGLMWPLQNKATQSMKKMAALQPKMAELKVKYKDDPARQQQELMKLYKDYQINPAAGCLPMIVQIPVFFGFYSMLGKAVELRNARFLWVNDLSQMDTVAWIPLLNQPLNILPLLMALTMLWQMSLSPKTGDPIQQRVFMFMPLIFVIFCYKYASALALYWTVQNLFSVVQLYITRDQAAPVLQKVSASSKKR